MTQEWQEMTKWVMSSSNQKGVTRFGVAPLANSAADEFGSKHG